MWTGSMPTSSDCSQLQSIIPLNANVWLSGATIAVEVRKCRRLTRSKIGEQNSAFLDHRIRFLSDVGAEIAVVGFGRRLEAFAVDIEQPAVKRAAQAAIFEAAIREVGAAMRTAAADQPVAATLVPEDNQIFPEQPHRLYGPIAGQFVDERRGLPIAPQQASRRSAGTGPGNEIVLLDTQHREPSLFTRADSIRSRRTTGSVDPRQTPKMKRPAQWPATNAVVERSVWGAWPSPCPCGGAKRSGADQSDAARRS